MPPLAVAGLVGLGRVEQVGTATRPIFDLADVSLEVGQVMLFLLPRAALERARAAD